MAAQPPRNQLDFRNNGQTKAMAGEFSAERDGSVHLRRLNGFLWDRSRVCFVLGSALPEPPKQVFVCGCNPFIAVAAEARSKPASPLLSFALSATGVDWQ
jgi:hypothetical protein